MNRSRSRRALAAVALTLLATAATAAPAAARDPLQAQLDRFTRAHSPGAVLLTGSGERPRVRASGAARLRPRRALRAGDRFKVASLTKTFTASLVVGLAAERRLMLEDPVARWLPGLVPGGERITLRQLLNHSSGLADYAADERALAPFATDPGFAWRPEQLVALGTAQPPHFAPGAGFRYSNTNYLLLGLVVEAVTGAPFAVALEERILRPLSLRDTALELRPRLERARAHGYAEGGRDVTALSGTLEWTAGAIVSSARDLARFYGALLGGRVVPSPWLRVMQATVPGTDPAAGLGLFRYDTSCGPAWGHDGSVPGYGAVALVSGRRRTVLLLNTNALDAAGQRAFSRLLDRAHCPR